MRICTRSRAFRPVLEHLETRLVPYSLNGYSWADTNVSASFMPDQTPIWSNTSDLIATYNARYPTATWQREFARALQTWAAVTPLNFHFVADEGLASGTSGSAQGDSRFGDIRLGAHPGGGSYLAYAYPAYPSGTRGGDIALNSSEAFNIGSSYDLYSVLVHEIGHTLGLEHGSLWESVMYPAVTRVFTGLFADDVAGIQAVYGARQADAHDATAANDSLASATSLSLSGGAAALSADLTTLADVDHYRFVVPAGADGRLTVSLDARGISLLSPRVAVYDAGGRLVTSASAGYGKLAQVTLSGLAAGAAYVVVADGASGDVFGMGAYELKVQFGGTSSGSRSSPVAPPTSALIPLPAVTRSSNFTVAWAGSAGSGVAGYDVLVSADGGAYVPWLEGTTATSAVFAGAFHREYRFQVFATDTAGRRQETPGEGGTRTVPFLSGAVAEDTVRTAGFTVAALVGTHLRGLEPGTLKGVAVEGASGVGTWQFSIDGGRTWYRLNSASPSAARLLRATDRVRFVPARNWNGAALLTFRVWDRRGGLPGRTANLSGSVSGGPFGVRRYGAEVVVRPSNDAPLLPAGSTFLGSVEPTETAPAGIPVAEMLATATDPDPGALRGIAVVGSAGRGIWQYSRDGGNTWTAFGAVSASRARLLRDTDLVRFVPDASGTFNGLATISYRAWDRSNPAATLADLTLPGATGGRTPYSAGVRTGRMLVNTAPVLTPPATPPAGSIAEDAPHSFGYLVGSLAPASAAADADPNPLAGVAVVGATGKGTWQFSVNGGRTWVGIGEVSGSLARLLRDTDRVRFLPARDWNGQAALTYHAWDRTLGAAGGLLGLTRLGVGGSSCCSSASGEMVIHVTPVNDAPVLPSAPVSLPAITRTEVADVALAHLLAGVQDPDGPFQGVVVTGVAGPGTWQFSLAGGAWQTLGPGGSLLLGEGARLRFVTSGTSGGQASLAFRAWDGTSGSEGEMADLSGGFGGQTAFSVVNRLATLLVDEAS